MVLLLVHNLTVNALKMGNPRVKIDFSRFLFKGRGKAYMCVGKDDAHCDDIKCNS